MRKFFFEVTVKEIFTLRISHFEAWKFASSSLEAEKALRAELATSPVIVRSITSAGSEPVTPPPPPAE